MQLVQLRRRVEQPLEVLRGQPAAPTQIESIQGMVLFSDGLDEVRSGRLAKLALQNLEVADLRVVKRGGDPSEKVPTIRRKVVLGNFFFFRCIFFFSYFLKYSMELVPAYQMVLDGRDPNATELDLRDTSLGNEGALAISARFLRLEVLRLTNTSIVGAGACPLAALPHLMELDLRDNKLGDEGAVALIRAILSNNLMFLNTLNLSNNGITSAGARNIVPLDINGMFSPK